MPLLNLWRSNPESISAMSLDQIVKVSGNGKLLDDSETSRELRAYLSQISTGKIESYVSYCLTNPFDQGGYVLQDIVNELGRRLEYDVVNGAYAGRKGAIGYDGIWTLHDGYSIVVEVKTTDAYRINLDTIASYRDRLIGDGKIGTQSSILIVVGRKDTGDVEAQIRGSRHAWSIRMISAESLLKLVALKEASEDEVTLNKIRSLLVPFEYTRLDNIIDIVFTTAADVSSFDEIVSVEEVESAQSASPKKHNKQIRTDQNIISSIRTGIVEQICKRNSINLIAKSKALYWTGDKKYRIVCTISKYYADANNYWYALHKRWIDFLKDGDVGLYVVGFVDEDRYVAMPVDFIGNVVGRLSKTVQGDNEYWHVLIEKRGNGYSLCLAGGDRVDVSSYAHSFS